MWNYFISVLETWVTRGVWNGPSIGSRMPGNVFITLNSQLSINELNCFIQDIVKNYSNRVRCWLGNRCLIDWQGTEVRACVSEAQDSHSEVGFWRFWTGISFPNLGDSHVSHFPRKSTTNQYSLHLMPTVWNLLLRCLTDSAVTSSHQRLPLLIMKSICPP